MKTLLFTLLITATTVFSLRAQTNNGIPLPGRTTIESANSAASGLANLAQIYSFYNPDRMLQAIPG
jgi:hypothetical protein